MKRRELLKALSLSSMATFFPAAWPRIVSGNTADNPLWFFVFANGAFDPVSFCNPRSNNQFYTSSNGVQQSTPMSNYPPGEIETVGNIKLTRSVAIGKPTAYGSFVDLYSQDLLVINGIETSNNNHLVGSRIGASGSASVTHPSFAAYAAAMVDGTLPLAHLGGPYSGSTRDAGLVFSASLPDSSLLAELYSPAFQQSRTIFDQSIYASIKAKKNQRDLRQIESSQLPRETVELKAFHKAQSSQIKLKDLKDNIPTSFEQQTDPFKQQIQLGCAGMAAGLTVSAQIGLGFAHNNPLGWDSHGNHDNRAQTNLNMLFTNLIFLREEAERQGLTNRLNIIVSSDFGRTPFFNEKAGKDHWSVGSMLFMGPKFTGNRMVELCDVNLRARPVNLNTLAPSSEGEIITSAHVFRSLRALTGPLDEGIDLLFPLRAPGASMLAPAVPKLFTG